MATDGTEMERNATVARVLQEFSYESQAPRACYARV